MPPGLSLSGALAFPHWLQEAVVGRALVGSGDIQDHRLLTTLSYIPESHSVGARVWHRVVDTVWRPLRFLSASETT